MNVIDKPINVPPLPTGARLLPHLASSVERALHADEVPVRFVVTESDAAGFRCELAVLSQPANHPDRPPSIFKFRRREYEDNTHFNAVMLIPTGINCEIGGHAGDATPTARLLASMCDTLIIHPNVVNASDINELPENCLCVEGSVLCRLLMGTVGLQKVHANRVLCLVEEHEIPALTDATINAFSAARATLGLNCAGVLRLENPCAVVIEFATSGRASGRIGGLDNLVALLRERRDSYDAVAIVTTMRTGAGLEQITRDYYLLDTINPWGGVEAMLTHTLSMLLDVPTMHSPMADTPDPLDFGLVDPRKASEVVSRTYTHCILKGLHRSPRIITDRAMFGKSGVMSAEDIHCLVIPEGCLGLPILAALEQGIPVIAVRENANLMKNDLEKLPFRDGQYFLADNYLEAAGVLAALKAGVAPSATRRPFPPTHVTAVAVNAAPEPVLAGR